MWTWTWNISETNHFLPLVGVVQERAKQAHLFPIFNHFQYLKTALITAHCQVINVLHVGMLLGLFTGQIYDLRFAYLSSNLVLMLILPPQSESCLWCLLEY